MGNSQENNEENQVQIPQIQHSYTLPNFNFNSQYHYICLNYNDMPNLFWIDPNVENHENYGYQRQIRNINAFRLEKFTNIDVCIEKLKKIEFKKTFIIVSGSFSKEFFTKMEGIVNELKVIPKIIIFTSSRRYKEIKGNILNLDAFDLFDINLVFDYFDPVLDELKCRNIYNFNQNCFLNNMKNNKNNNFSFEYIEESKQLILPLYLTDFFGIPNQNEIKDFNKFVLKNFSNNNEIKELIEQLFLKSKVPLQILIKYWLRAYTIQSTFYSQMNIYLRERLGNQFDTYIKVLYYGLKQNYISSCIDKELFRGGIITKDELKYIINSLDKKKKNLPGCICYNKSYLSTSQDKKVALDFMNNKELDNNKVKVLYRIQPVNDLYKDNATNVDIEKFSNFQTEKEILFFPFSSFEIVSIEPTDNNYYQINLVYLGKYKNKIKITEKIPESNLTKDILSSTIIDKIDLEKKSSLFDFDVNKYIPPESKQGYIIATYDIKNTDLDKKIQILNYNFQNKNEIQDICKIYIENKLVEFSFFKSFSYPGKYTFKFFFKNLLTNASKLFCKCKSLISIDLKNFKTNNITNMNNMFNGCSNLETLDLLGFKTKEVTSMRDMFYDCISLKSIDLSELDTSKVINMSNMFGNCSSLTYLNLSKFNTKNVFDMSQMFKNCSSLYSINLSNFDTSKVRNMNDMFSGCSSLASLDLYKFNISSKTTIENMFFKCNSLKNLNISKELMKKSKQIYSMFNNSKNFQIPTLEFNKNKNSSDRRYSSITTEKTFKKFKIFNYFK